jgi:hypothetical protein
MAERWDDARVVHCNGRRGLIGFASMVAFVLREAVGHDVCDVGDVVEKFMGDPPGAGGNLPQRSVIVGFIFRPPLRRSKIARNDLKGFLSIGAAHLARKSSSITMEDRPSRRVRTLVPGLGWPVARDSKQYQDIDALPSSEAATPPPGGYNPPDGPRVLGAGGPIGSATNFETLNTGQCDAHTDSRAR